jgi:NTF2-related export protein 1/2
VRRGFPNHDSIAPGFRSPTQLFFSFSEIGSQPPSLLITVSGNVTHGGGPGANPPLAPKKTIDGHPRVFSQTFMLVPDNTAAPKLGEVAKYYIIADTMRFVG